MKIVIVDIDGTISIIGNRLKYLNQSPPNWDAFYEACGQDTVNRPIANLVDDLDYHYEIVYLTGRRESCREATVQWLEDNELPFDDENEQLLMRANGDYRHDTIVKPENLKKAGIELRDIAFILEDRDSMVKKWRELGLTCLQVAEGDF